MQATPYHSTWGMVYLGNFAALATANAKAGFGFTQAILPPVTAFEAVAPAKRIAAARVHHGRS